MANAVDIFHSTYRSNEKGTVHDSNSNMRELHPRSPRVTQT